MVGMKKEPMSIKEVFNRSKSQPSKQSSAAVDFDVSLSGAHIHDREKVFQGFNLFDGRLIDLEGNTIQRWGARYLGCILSDGCYIAQRHYKSLSWGLYSWNGKQLWEKKDFVHHDIIVTTRGTLIALQYEQRSIKGKKIIFPVVVEYDMNGKELMRSSSSGDLSWFKLLLRLSVGNRSRKLFALRPYHRYQNDYFHMNSFQLLPDTILGRRDRRFRQGNWLISLRDDSLVAVIDQDTYRSVWTCAGADLPDELQGQHAPTMLSNGRMLIFDNGCFRRWSRVIEIDPVIKKIVWEYRARGFFTRSQGYAQRLDNGNTLVTESERGRAFEISRNGNIVWEYYHPQQQDASNSAYPESYGSRQWIYRMVRYSREFIEPLMHKESNKS